MINTFNNFFHCRYYTIVQNKTQYESRDPSVLVIKSNQAKPTNSEATETYSIVNQDGQKPFVLWKKRQLSNTLELKTNVHNAHNYLCHLLLPSLLTNTKQPLHATTANSFINKQNHITI